MNRAPVRCFLKEETILCGVHNAALVPRIVQLGDYNPRFVTVRICPVSKQVVEEEFDDVEW